MSRGANKYSITNTNISTTYSTASINAAITASYGSNTSQYMDICFIATTASNSTIEDSSYLGSNNNNLIGKLFQKQANGEWLDITTSRQVAFTDETLITNVTPLRRAHTEDIRTFLRHIQQYYANRYGDIYYNSHNMTLAQLLWKSGYSVNREYMDSDGNLNIDIGTISTSTGTYFTNNCLKVVFRNTSLIADWKLGIYSDGVQIKDKLYVLDRAITGTTSLIGQELYIQGNTLHLGYIPGERIKSNTTTTIGTIPNILDVQPKTRANIGPRHRRTALAITEVQVDTNTSNRLYNLARLHVNSYSDFSNGICFETQRNYSSNLDAFIAGDDLPNGSTVISTYTQYPNYEDLQHYIWDWQTPVATNDPTIAYDADSEFAIYDENNTWIRDTDSHDRARVIHNTNSQTGNPKGVNSDRLDNMHWDYDPAYTEPKAGPTTDPLNPEATLYGIKQYVDNKVESSIIDVGDIYKEIKLAMDLYTPPDRYLLWTQEFITYHETMDTSTYLQKPVKIEFPVGWLDSLGLYGKNNKFVIPATSQSSHHPPWDNDPQFLVIADIVGAGACTQQAKLYNYIPGGIPTATLESYEPSGGGYTRMIYPYFKPKTQALWVYVGRNNSNGSLFCQRGTDGYNPATTEPSFGQSWTDSSVAIRDVENGNQLAWAYGLGGNVKEPNDSSLPGTIYGGPGLFVMIDASCTMSVQANNNWDGQNGKVYSQTVTEGYTDNSQSPPVSVPIANNIVTWGERRGGYMPLSRVCGCTSQDTIIVKDTDMASISTGGTAYIEPERNGYTSSKDLAYLNRNESFSGYGNGYIRISVYGNPS